VNFKRILPSLDSFIDTMTRQTRRVGEQGGQRLGRDRVDSGCSTDSRQGPLNEAACMAIAAPKMNLAVRVEKQGRYGVRLLRTCPLFRTPSGPNFGNTGPDSKANEVHPTASVS
jgi:hypothetical protein